MLIQKIWTTIKIIIPLILIIYCLICLLIYLFQDKLIYFPEKKILYTPTSINLPYEDIIFTTSDNIKLYGWFIPCENSKKTILFCHGNAGNISHRLESIMIFNKLGFNVFIFDYRGYGKSTGKPSEKGTCLDVEAAWKYITTTRNISASQIMVFGRSLGGSIATWLAYKYTPKALIIESTFTSVQDIARQYYPYLPVRLLLRIKYNTLAIINKIKCPVLIIHSYDDDIIPFKHGQKLFDMAVSPKEFLEIEGSHNDGFYVSGQKYEQGLCLFIDKYEK